MVTLTTVILRTISNQSRLTHHQVTRIQAQYAAKAGMILAFDKLRKGIWSQHATEIKYYCIEGKNGLTDLTCTDGTLTDNDPLKGLPYSVQIAIYPKNQPGINDTAKIEVKTGYTYTPD